jgi:hypothetical protein
MFDLRPAGTRWLPPPLGFMQTNKTNNETATAISPNDGEQFLPPGKLEIEGPIFLQTGREKYRLNLPAHIVYAVCSLPAGTVVHNGRVMEEEERKFIAAHLCGWADHFMSPGASLEMRKSLQERWPMCNFYRPEKAQS